MQILSTTKYARISAFKAREVTRAIQGLPVAAALDIVAFSPKKAAVLVAKTLKSAVANAENNANLRVDTLVVKEATVGEGPTAKRFQPKARGSAGPILKRSSHIRIVLTDEVKIETRATRAAAKAAASKPAAKKSTRKSAASAGDKPAAKKATKSKKAAAPAAPSNEENQ
jgi:large subunit ribosomal protein L22